MDFTMVFFLLPMSVLKYMKNVLDSLIADEYVM